MFDDMNASEALETIGVLNEVYADMEIKHSQAVRAAEFYQHERDKAALEIRVLRRRFGLEGAA